MGARKKISPAVAALAGAALAVGGIAGTTTAPTRLRRHEPVWIGYPRPRNDHKYVNRRRQRAVNA